MNNGIFHNKIFATFAVTQPHAAYAVLIRGVF